MIRVGITGQNGFVAYHLYQTINLLNAEFSLVDFDRSAFEDENKLRDFVSNCDVIVHLAGMNRHESQQVIYDTNIRLAQVLVDALEFTGNKPHVLFSSSTQEGLDNLYGNSKKHAREILASWANKNGAVFSGLLIPNVFGPFCKPEYNSFIATFCHKLVTGAQPEIKVDSEVNLIYVGELVTQIIETIRNKNEQVSNNEPVVISHTSSNKVSKILELLVSYKENYCDIGIIPELNNQFELNLFNTFRCYFPHKEYFPKYFKKNIDPRGAFVEVIRLGIGGQVSYSTTVPGITRGNHFHTRKIERFAVIKGKAKIQLRKIGTSEVFDFYLDGESPSYVDMPIWYTHNIENIGEEELLTIFWINEHYNPADPDTFFVVV